MEKGDISMKEEKETGNINREEKQLTEEELTQVAGGIGGIEDMRGNDNYFAPFNDSKQAKVTPGSVDNTSLRGLGSIGH